MSDKKTVKWIILMRTSMENGNVNGKENHSGQDEGSVEDVNISSLH